MKCNRYRLFITILASFASFFAYVCRLNLSLVIEEMVVKDTDELNTDGLSPLNVAIATERAELAKTLPYFKHEEQALAALSTTPSQWFKRKKVVSVFGKKNKTTTTAQVSTIKQISPLSIELNIADQAATANSQNGATQSSAISQSSTQASIEQRQQLANFDDVKIEPLLLKWTKEDRNDLLGAFFLGYVIFQIPAGRAAELFGAKLLLIWLGLGTGVSSLLFPYACRWSDGILYAYAIRFLMGASQAGLFPSIYVLLCEWLPKRERSSWLTVPSAAGRIGTIVMNLIVPLVMAYFNWETVFMLSGGVMLTWCALFVIFGSDSPASSRWLSHNEFLYIESRMKDELTPRPAMPTTTTTLNFSHGGGSTLDSQFVESSKTDKKPSINWLKMIKSRALLVLTLVMFTSEWSNMLLLVKLPGFLGPALGMDLAEIGMWSSCLVLVYCVHYPLSGVLASRLEAAEYEYMNSLRIRKLFELSAHLLQAIGCLLIAFFSHRTIVLVALFIIMLGRSTVGGGQCLMPPELSKDYPGTVMALANSFANVAGVIGPIIVSQLVTEPTNYNSWRPLWLLSAALFLLGALIFCLFAENRPQNYGKKCTGQKLAHMSISTTHLVMPNIQQQAFNERDHQYEQKRRQNQGGELDLPQRAVVEEILEMDSFSRLSSEPPQAGTSKQQDNYDAKQSTTAREPPKEQLFRRRAPSPPVRSK